jgi:hypothetical protein
MWQGNGSWCVTSHPMEEEAGWARSSSQGGLAGLVPAVCSR